jgi:hypothetical protein
MIKRKTKNMRNSKKSNRKLLKFNNQLFFENFQNKKNWLGKECFFKNVKRRNNNKMRMRMMMIKIKI